MLKILKYAEKLDKFFKNNYTRTELHYTVSVQLNFSIEVSLYMPDASEFTREQLKEDYASWMERNATVHGKDWRTEYDEDITVYFEDGAVKFYVSDFGELGDPGEDENANGLKHMPTYRLSSLLSKNTGDNALNLPPVVTFYSYKGGMGRTTTMMGFALWLAAKNKRVAILDCDLEAPGYLNFFNLSNQVQFSEGNKNGFVEFMADYGFMKEGIEVSDYTVIPVPPANNPGLGTLYDNIFIVPAGNLNDGFIYEKSAVEDETEFEAERNGLSIRNREDYIQGLARLNLSNPTVLKHGLGELVMKLQTQYKIDIVLIDSRTGFNDVYGSTASGLADMMVGFFGFSKQTMPGLKQLLDSYAKRAAGEKPLSLVLCNSILPSVAALDSDALLAAKWKAFGKVFAIQVDNICKEKNVPVPAIFPLHRLHDLEELGMDPKADLKFTDTVVNDKCGDLTGLYTSIYTDITARFPQLLKEPEVAEETLSDASADGDGVYAADTSESLEYIRNMRPLQLTKVILRNLKEKLETVANFAEQMEGQSKEMFLYRDCMKEIFDPNKFIVRGYKGAGKTCIYQALGQSNEVTDFIRKRADVESDCDFVNVIDFQGISKHPLKLLENDGIFEGQRFFNINAFWQILMWKAIFANDKYTPLLEESALKEQFFKLNGLKDHKLLIAIQDLMDAGASRVLAAIEDDLERLENHLALANRQLFIMYDGLDNVVKPKYWSRAVSPLINQWGGNLNAYRHIHSKIFLRTDLFERIEGTNIERLKDNIVDIDWEIGEVFGYLFKLVLGADSNPSREAMWQILRRLRPDSAEATIDNMTRAIKNGLGQFPTFDRPNLKYLVEIFFGREVIPVKGSNLGHPWQYFEKQLSNAGEKISMRLFINTLTTDVIDKGLENSYPHVHEVISPEIYASREVRIKVAESYFNDMASEEDFTVDLQKLRDFINSEKGKDFRKKTLDELEFNTLLNNIIEIYRHDLRAVETPAELAQLIYASGLMKEVYRRGHKIYKFSPMFEYPWGLAGKLYDEDDTQDERPTKIKDGDVLEGILDLNKFGKPAVKVGEWWYECEGYTRLPMGSKVSFTVHKRPKVGKKGVFNMASDLKLIRKP